MGKSLYISILLPMNEYKSSEVYDSNDRLRQIYCEKPRIRMYFKQLKVRSKYAATKDIQRYIIKKYGIAQDQFRNYSVSYRLDQLTYNFRDGQRITLNREEHDSLIKEHIDKGIYCCPYKHFEVDVYGAILSELFKEYFTVIDNKLIDTAIKLTGEQYSSYDNIDSVEDSVFEEMINYDSSMEGKLIVSLIAGQYIAKRVCGIAVVEYD